MKFTAPQIVARLMVVLVTLFCTCASSLAAEVDHAKVMADLRAKEEHVGVWQRFPTIGAPLMTTAPKIDGTIEASEWFGAAKLGGMVDYNKGLALPDRCDLYVGYSATHLYIAFSFARPDGAKQPGARDFFELLIDPPHTGAKYHNAGLGLDKILWTGIGPSVDKKAWQPALDYKARLTDWGWEGELAIPFKEFGLEAAPSPGTIWGIDFVRNENTPVDRLAVWAFRGKNWHAVNNLGHLRFTGKPVAIKVESLGWMLDSKQAGSKVLVSNYSDQPVTLASHMELRRADKPVQMDYYARIDSAMAEGLPAAIGSPLQNEVNGALEAYPVVKEEDKSVVVAPNSSALIDLTMPDEPGKYLAGFAIKENDVLVAGGLVPVDITVPLAIKLDSYLYSAQTLAYRVDLRRVTGLLGAGAEMSIDVADPSGKSVAKAQQPIAAGATESEGIVQFEPASGATYAVTASITSGGKVAATNQQHLRLPSKPEWMGNQIGMSKFVPEPFKEVVVEDGKRVTLLTTKLDWSGNTLLPGVNVHDKDILAAPISLTFKGKDGVALPVKVTVFDVASKDVEQVTFNVKADIADQGTIDGTITVEFDGLVWYRLKLSPKASLDLTESTLTFALKKEFATHCTVGAADGKTVFSNAVPDEPLISRFSFCYWVGGMDGGIQWFAENPCNWFNASAKDVARITKTANGADLTIKFIDKPVTLDKAIDWSFGFIATPSRVKPAKWGDFAFLQKGMLHDWPIPEPPADQDPRIRWEANHRWNYYANGGWERDKKNIYSYIHHATWQEIFGYPGTFDQVRRNKMKKSADFLHSQGIKTILYAGWGMNTAAPEWNDFGSEMVMLPLNNSGYGTFRQCPTTLWQDWFIFKTAEMIRDLDCDGLFIDSVTSPMMTMNYTPGMRWTDETGAVRGSYPILASRMWLKRLYKMFHGEIKKDGIVFNHNSPPAIMAIETFADVRTPSEYAQTHQGEFDKNFVDFFIAKNGGDQFGLFSELTNKDQTGDWAVKKTSQVYAICLPLNVSIKGNSIYMDLREHGDYKPGTQMMPWIWRANRWVDKNTALYLPWWKNSEYITTSPADDQVLTAIWLQKGDRALLCVSNLKSQPRKIDVSLTPSALGFSGITAVDAITGESIPVEGGRMSLDVDFERFRLIQLTNQK